VREDLCDGTEIACNDDDGLVNTSQVQIEVVDGGVYYVFVDGFSASGAYVFNIQPGACP
jgi:hypothetical protein